AEDGIRDFHVTGVQTCALPISASGHFGAQCIVVAIDAKMVAPGRWEVFTHGGRRSAGLDAIDWARRVEELGAGEILLTSMDRDEIGRAACRERVEVSVAAGAGG